jgi:hypothetical protein
MRLYIMHVGRAVPRTKRPFATAVTPFVDVICLQTSTSATSVYLTQIWTAKGNILGTLKILTIDNTWY